MLKLIAGTCIIQRQSLKSLIIETGEPRPRNGIAAQEKLSWIPTKQI